MHIESINLTNFRNYEKLDFHPSSGLNVLVGMNAQGKSGVLEAIYFLATSKSHRTSRDLDLIRLGQDMARACAHIKRVVRNDETVEIILSKAEKKTVKINGVKHPKIGDIVGQLNAVIFSNSDIDMVKGDPSRRRRFLNLEISQVTPQYVYALGRYKRVLDQRNNLLREIKNGTGRVDALGIWDDQLALYGATILSRRAKFVDYLAGAASRVFSSLTGESETLGVTYKPNLQTSATDSEEDIVERFARALAGKREYDLMRATTTVGPHRDDIVFSVNNLSAREYASQGQQRTVAISLKLAEIELMEEYIAEPPIVLLDDVMAELDESRRTHILELTVGRCQTFITTTHISELDTGLISDGSIFEVSSGTVTQK